MCNSEDIKATVKDHEGDMYDGLRQLITDNRGFNNTIKKDIILESKLLKYKPSKHRKAYRLENNFRKRCYAR